MNKTRVARSILRVLNDAHMPINRQGIARAMGKRYLMRHDIKTLNRLLDIDLVVGYKRVRWEVLDERFAGRYSGGRPDIHSDIANGSVSWWYEITEAGAQVIQQADRWMERPATIPKRSAPAISPGDQQSSLAITRNDQRSLATINDDFEFHFDLDDIPNDQSDLPPRPGEETKVIETLDEGSIISKMVGAVEWFLNQK